MTTIKAWPLWHRVEFVKLTSVHNFVVCYWKEIPSWAKLFLVFDYH